MNEYELPVHRRKHGFREISILVVQFSDLAYGIRQEIYSQQPIYFSYTYQVNLYMWAFSLQAEFYYVSFSVGVLEEFGS
jgi:hypothetical protein